jgi:RNA polymerase sigma factor (sigma-70 family)
MAMDLSLTDKQREVVRMYYIDNKKMPEIAEILGINKSSVHKILKRAIKKLEFSKKYF